LKRTGITFARKRSNYAAGRLNKSCIPLILGTSGEKNSGQEEAESACERRLSPESVVGCEQARSGFGAAALFPDAQLCSIRGVAKALDVAPSAISRTIQALESVVGLPLFERVRQRLKLTGAGEILVYHARASDICKLSSQLKFGLDALY
jgi:Bacterial regulatory helix-turn-helix protein, lysR family